MLKQERFQLILQHLQKDNKVVLPKLSRLLKVSEDTVRRDIKELSAQKLLQEVRGGAIPHAPGPHDFRERENFEIKKKQIIAKKAIGFIKKGQTIIIDSGTSALAVANMLPKDLGLTVVTNSFPIVNMLQERKDIELFFAGGKLMRESYITTGHDTLDFFAGIRADVLFLGVCSIDLQLGITGHYYEECAIKRAMIKSASQVIALSTPEKLNTAEAFNICPITDISGIITSTPASDLLKPYKDAGIKVW
jgi:DeoR/GlpR family transcriptional regulator of sugar metabolism